ncbi:ABC transporter permease [Oligoflexus tunisiensis]|uniref:ABC transporter permease n=1 Tax=Oligoflexus tunisiensis TaxID=708132 RepID=UPI000B26F025|nr:ABC transporter permease [Oligoflexus tunisiensis]
MNELINEGESPGKRAWQRFKRHKFNLICLGVILAYALIAVAGYFGVLPDFQERVGSANEAPSLSFAKMLGTDLFGRSVLYKILVGTRTAITIGFLTTLISVPVGIFFGSIAGYFGGKVDAAVMWVYTVLASIPSILLLVGIAYVLGKGLLSICVAMAAVTWVGLCRLIRGEVMKHKNMEYVLASRLLGASDFRLIFRHILPNVFHLAIISASLITLTAIKFEVILTFLGVGIQDGSSWGTMVSDAAGELVNGIWWPLFGVTVAMFLILYALNIVGDALRDALDPKFVD